MRPPATPASDRHGNWHFAARVLVVAAVAALVLLLWMLRDVLLLAFAAMLVALVLRTVAGPARRRFGAPPRLALALAVLLILGLLAGAAWVFGSQLQGQARDLLERLPQAWAQLQARLGGAPLGQLLLDGIEHAGQGDNLLGRLQQAGLSMVALLTNAVLVLVGGIYLAAHPRLYQRGALSLLPLQSRRRAARGMLAAGMALRRWLIGQGAAMLAVGVLTGLGLWAIGVPSVVPLALVAALLEFIPVIGPILAALPALVIALTVDTATAWWTLALYVAIQQFEGNVLTPLVQRRAVSLPPALTLFSLLAFALLFGPLGLLLAAPLTVVAYSLVRTLWVRGALARHEGTRSPALEEIGNG